jgi:hypothetical protein
MTPAGPRRLLPPLFLLAALAAAPLAAQVAPTLPRDTLGGRKLPPEANVPRGVVAPTLPRDTLGGRTLPPTAEVVRSSVPTTPSDTLNARSRDSVAATKQPAETTAAVPAAKRPRNARLRVPH